MRIPELFEQKRPVFSMEIFPPKKKANIESIYDTVEKIAVCKPDSSASLTEQAEA